MKPFTIKALMSVFRILSVATLAIIMIITLTIYRKDRKHKLLKYAQKINKGYHDGFVIDTTGCKIPNIVFSKQYLQKYYKIVAPIECADKRAALFVSNYTSIYMNESALPMYGFQDKTTIDCCYMWLKRMPLGQDSNTPDDSVLFQNECVFFSVSVKSPYEFIRVHCFDLKGFRRPTAVSATKINKLKPFYTDYFYFIYPPLMQMQLEDKEEKVNILIVGVDSTSRLNFHRQMPFTSQYLKNLDAVEMFGFNKIGDNTFPNVITMLTGNSSSEILNGCFKESLTEKVFDHCKFIWDEYKTHGYATAFVEDAIKMGLFNYKPNRKGFLKQPTDFYWNIFYKAATEGMGNKAKVFNPYCIGTRKIYEVMLESIIRYTTVMDKNKQPYFGHFWQSLLAHDDVNQLHNGDVVYSQLLTYLTDMGLLNNTVLFFMSDHGFRFGNVRKTYQGMLEDRLPFVFVKLPNWLKHRHPHLLKNLHINSKRLVTMYDIYETFRQLLEPQLLTDSNWNIGKKRGNSLLSPINENRTCDDADIPGQWCVCQVSVPVPLNDETVILIAEFMVAHININILTEFLACARLSFDKVIYARKSYTGERVDVKEGEFDEIFTIGFNVAPSNALFEGSVIRNTKSRSLTLSDTISRLQLFKNESLCITNHFAQMYCFCTDLL